MVIGLPGKYPRRGYYSCESNMVKDELWYVDVTV